MKKWSPQHMKFESQMRFHGNGNYGRSISFSQSRNWLELRFVKFAAILH